MLCINACGFLNSAVNPIIYLMAPSFRRKYGNAIHHLFYFCCHPRAAGTSGHQPSSYGYAHHRRRTLSQEISPFPGCICATESRSLSCYSTFSQQSTWKRSCWSISASLALSICRISSSDEGSRQLSRLRMSRKTMKSQHRPRTNSVPSFYSNHRHLSFSGGIEDGL
jgi:hypothetical protein